MNVQDIMSRPVVTCALEDTLSTAARLMWEHDIGALPVVSVEGSVVGVITDRDICMAAYTQGKTLDTLPVSGAISGRVHSCGPGDSVEKAERLMADGQVHRLPVMDGDGHPVGVVSLNDVARYPASPARRNSHGAEIAQTLVAISEPRGQSLAARPTAPPAAASRRMRAV